jgi:hypothetical protein
MRPRILGGRLCITLAACQLRSASHSHTTHHSRRLAHAWAPQELCSCICAGQSAVRTSHALPLGMVSPAATAALTKQ